MDNHITVPNCQALVYSLTFLLTTLVDPLTLNLDKLRGLERENKVFRYLSLTLLEHNIT